MMALLFLIPFVGLTLIGAALLSVSAGRPSFYGLSAAVSGLLGVYVLVYVWWISNDCYDVGEPPDCAAPNVLVSVTLLATAVTCLIAAAAGIVALARRSRRQQDRPLQ